MTRQKPGRQVARTHWFVSRWCAFHGKPFGFLGPLEADISYWFFNASIAPEWEWFAPINEDKFGLIPV